MQRKRTDEMNGIVGGEEEGNKVRYMIRMEMAEGDDRDLAKIQTQLSHLPQGTASPVQENKMRSE